MSKFTSGVRVSGWVTIWTENVHGLRLVIYDGPNQILNNGLSTFGKLLTQQSIAGSDRQVTSIKFGDDNTAAAATQTDIQGSLIIDKAIVTYAEDIGGTPGKVSFETTLDTSEGNGNTIQEIALMCSDGTAIARRVTPAIPKTNLITVGVNWQIIFSTS